ncbi:unnamed protein product [Anisakis simplex]|uniref:Anoctamin n=1 Tax=Anisakis simplex TaxID=6269 RepID=A0A0M3K6Z1_ANISI|nr:unnamed protein product [Anisakis simplex]
MDNDNDGDSVAVSRSSIWELSDSRKSSFVSSSNAVDITTVERTLDREESRQNQSSILTVTDGKLPFDDRSIRRKYGTFYTPENMSLLLDALISDQNDDWRAGMNEPVIIWSHESKYHPDYGKYSPGIIQRYIAETATSRYMSFVILGIVVAFLLYVYLNHLFEMRMLRRLREQERLRQILQQSAIIMANSVVAQHMNDATANQRRLSILNLFRAFRL